MQSASGAITHLTLARCFLGIICIFLAGAGQAMAETSQTNAAVLELKKNFKEMHQRYLTETNDVETAWHFARACYDMADLTRDSVEKAELAAQGIAAARLALSENSNSAPAHYYLGMNLGELADTKHNLSALRMVREIDSEFLTALALDKHFDYAGPDRNLGLLYWQAPVIASVGSRTKARQHLLAAVQLAPEFPENHLNLIEAYLKWDNRVEALRQLAQLERRWPEAHKQFTGDEWALSWAAWDKRLDAVEKKLEGAVRATESPHSVR
jgi:tetratricopeptide (TPR) repeat protein